MSFFLPLLMAVAVTAALSPAVRWLAIKTGVVDHPNQRKIHTDAMPLLGGLAIFIGFWATVLVTQTLSKEIIALGAGSLLILISGIWDDSKDIRPVVKLVFQIAASCLIVFYGGIRITFVTSLFGANPQQLGWL
ncbi:MAG: undecaprenyl/decaprenyl-phosphate alpha-N-acetylglucosaminyl 1-phosphate transferase, partial [Peptococcaceae bacterium]|nr:undecaprenyl/decaprenyl-phosphate alpha-N-acetylglucosaminyl 1-phosphate transferase [Peptococcaceae bacterium]